jgi:hypothetical protein
MIKNIDFLGKHIMRGRKSICYHHEKSNLKHKNGKMKIRELEHFLNVMQMKKKRIVNSRVFRWKKLWQWKTACIIQFESGGESGAKFRFSF